MGRLSEYINGARGRSTYLNNKPIKAEFITDGLDLMISVLDDDEKKKQILYRAVIAGGKVLQGVAKQYFKQRVGEASTHISKYIKQPFVEGVVLKGDKAYLECRVSIMKDFRMKFFEKGTEDRYIKQKGHSDLQRGRHQTNTGKPNYRGRITGKWFFKDARNDSAAGINDAMMKSIDNALKRYGL